MSPLVVLALLPVAAAVQGKIDQGGVDQVEVDATFFPEERRIVAVAHYRWLGTPRDELAFYLNRSLELEAVEGDGVLDVKQVPGNSVLELVGDRYVVRLSTSDEPVELVFRYSGPLPEAFADDWIEVFADRLWVPIHESMARRFDFACTLHLPKAYRLVGYGRAEKTGETWSFRSVDPSLDIAFVAGKTETWDFARDGRRVRIVSRAIEESEVIEIASDVHWILDYFQRTFASEDPRGGATIVVRPGEKFPAYARPGYIVIGLQGSYSEQRDEYFKDFAHELSHLWWLNASSATYENWLNEGFAEYSSLMAVREFSGEHAFERRIESYRKRVVNVPPIIGLDRAHPLTEPAFYWKPAVILADLEDRIGREELLSLWRHVLAERVATTEELLTLLARLHGFDEADWLRGELGE